MGGEVRGVHVKGRGGEGRRLRCAIMVLTDRVTVS